MHSQLLKQASPVFLDLKRRILSSCPEWLSRFLGLRHVRLEFRQGVLHADLASDITSLGNSQSMAGSGRAALLTNCLPVLLIVPPEMILSREVEVPSGVVNDLQEALRHNISYWTPFVWDDVYARASIARRLGDRLWIDIHCITKVQLRTLTEEASVQGYVPDRILLHPSTRPIDLDTRKLRRLKRAVKVDLALAALAIALAIGAVGFWHWKIDALHTELSSLIRAEVTRLKEAEPLRREIETRKTLLRTVERERAALPWMTEVIADIARGLPEGAEVVGFEWNGQEGRLRVKSEATIDAAAFGAKIEIVGVQRSDTNEEAMASVELRRRKP